MPRFKLLEHQRFPPGSFNAYLLALLLIAIAVGIRSAIGSRLPGTQFITLFPAVILTTLCAGVAAGFVAVFCGALAAWYFILPPTFSFILKDGQAVALAFFVVISSVDVIIIGAMRTAVAEARALGTTLTTVYEANPDAIILSNRDGAILNINRRASELFGMPRAAMLGLQIDALLPERFRDGHASHRENFMADPRLRTMGLGIELFGRRADGSEFPVDVQIGAIEISGEKVAIATVRDLTEQNALARALFEVKAQKAVLEERQRSAEEMRLWADAFKWASVGIEISDPVSATIRFVNPAYAAMRGMAEKAAEGMPVALSYTEEERDRLPALFEEADTRGHIAFLSRHLRHDGTNFPVEIELASVRGDDGTVLYRLASSRDVTAARQTEEALRQAQKMEAIGNVTGGMAHDFNNLLGVIIGNLDLIDESMLRADGEAKELVDEALDAAMRGADLTRSLLAFARRQALRPISIDLNELVSGMSRLLARVLGEDIEISLELAPDLWPVVADAAQVEASIANLATNARDAMAKGGKLQIATGNRHLDADYTSLHPAVAPGDYAMISVSDNGIGMAPEVLAHIFEPFFTTKELGKGTGLGLSMVFGFANQSGGHVSVYSEAGVGTTIRLFLPRAQPADAAHASLADRARPVAGKGETILVVEDNVALRRVVIRQLTELNYVTLEAENPKQALTLLERETAALLFSDIVMPGGMDGFDLAALALARWPDLKVLLTSGFSRTRANEGTQGLPNSVRLISKPYRRDELASTIREVLDGEGTYGA